MAVAKNLVLSIFPGIDILGRGFEEEGYCVVRGNPEKIFSLLARAAVALIEAGLVSFEE